MHARTVHWAPQTTKGLLVPRGSGETGSAPQDCAPLMNRGHLPSPTTASWPLTLPPPPTPKAFAANLGRGHSHTSDVAQPGPCSSQSPGATLTHTFHPKCRLRPCTLQIKKQKTSNHLVKTCKGYLADPARPLTCCVSLARYLNLSGPVCSQ